MQKITKGIEIGGLRYGWLKKKLFRLPYSRNNRYYYLKEITPKNYNGKIYYILNRQIKSISVLKTLTKDVYWELDIPKKSEDCPF